MRQIESRDSGTELLVPKCRDLLSHGILVPELSRRFFPCPTVPWLWVPVPIPGINDFFLNRLWNHKLGARFEATIFSGCCNFFRLHNKWKKAAINPKFTNHWVSMALLLVKCWADSAWRLTEPPLGPFLTLIRKFFWKNCIKYIAKRFFRWTQAFRLLSEIQK